MRGEILALLRQADHVSGEQIASRLKISRAAVWKHVRALRQKGYKIDSAPGYGYTMISSTSDVVPEEITADLRTSLIGKSVLVYKEVTSTQDLADKLARSGAAEGTVVVAQKQMNGRGRKGRPWVSASDGIYISLILRPNLKPVYVVQVPMVIGIALSRAISKTTGLNTSIKWPNDILIQGKKVAGILTEMNSEMDKVNYIIPGIGINVNNRASGLPDEVRSIATTIRDEFGADISIVRLLRNFLEEMDEWYATFLKQGFPPIAEEWKRLNNTLGSRVKVYDGEIEIFGRAIDIDEEGFLLIQSDAGQTIRILSGDVSLRSQ
jgi:BirA family transcriptional regulator, biotin operon repressor / biotin---[acetyl-CoA-carboxylase] ligase